MGSFVFRSRWTLAAPADDVYAVLADVETYPAWWPQVRATQRLDDVSGELTCRSLLPYDLTFTMRREVEDPVERVLRARMTGDLIGTSQWRITTEGDVTVAVFDEDVDVGKDLGGNVGRGVVKAAGRLLRPALRANHDHMMRSGEKGLQVHLAKSSR